jgi:hypothetical protein
VHDGQLQRTLESHDSLFVILTSPTVSTIAAAAAAGSSPPVVTLEGGAPNATCAALQSCAYVKGRGCQCNYPECEKYHDCCPDVQAVCQDATCTVYGCHNKSALCSCTDSCSHEHKCCVDFYQACPRHHHPPGPPPSPPGPVTPVGPCGYESICPPQQFHLAPTETPTAITVSFVTGARFAAAPNCSLGTRTGAPTAHFGGVTTTYTDGGWLGKLHAVRMAGLAADGRTEYFYTCNGAAEFSFVSPPPPGAAAFPMVVAAVADLGSRCSRTGGGCGNNSHRR